MVGKYLLSFSGQELLRLYLLLLLPVTGLWCPKVGITLQLIAHPCFKAPMKPSLPYGENTTPWMLCKQAKWVWGPTTLKPSVLAAYGDVSQRLWWWDWDLRGLFSAEVLWGAQQFWPAALSLHSQKTGSNFCPWTSASSVGSLGLSGKQVEMVLVRISHTGNTNKGIKMSFKNWVPTEDKRLWNSLYKPN